MCIEISRLNVHAGDRRTRINTNGRGGRETLEKLIKESLRDGAVIFVKVGDDDFRVTDYDRANDELVVRKNEPRRRRSTFRIPANDTLLNIVPPTAGG